MRNYIFLTFLFNVLLCPSSQYEQDHSLNHIVKNSFAYFLTLNNTRDTLKTAESNKRLSGQKILDNGQYRTYSTKFPKAESPVSENRNWINGSTTGLDWGYVSTTPGLTHTHPGKASYADATALLTGKWNPDQMAEATVGSTENACTSDKCYPEVELRLRSGLSAHVCKGYEITFSLKPGSSAYLIIVRWNGPLGDFTYLFNKSGPQYHVKTGDAIKATVIGNVISAYKNGILMGQAIDSTYTNGNPGIGFNEQSYNGDYGFSSFMASDDPEYFQK